MATFLLATGIGRKESAKYDLPLIFLSGGLGACAVGYLFWLVAGKSVFFMSSTFYESDVFAGYLLLLIPLAASLAVFSDDGLRRLMYALVTVLFVLTLAFTDSRGAILVFCFVMILWFLFVMRKRYGTLRSVAVYGLVFTVFGSFYLALNRNTPFVHQLWEKTTNPSSWLVTISARLSFWKGAILIFLNHPFFGSGFDTFGRLFPMFQERFTWYSRYPHNFYLQLLSEGGILTFSILAAILVLVGQSGFRAVRASEKDIWLPLGLLLGFLAGVLHLLVDVDSNFTLWSVLFWGEAGLLVSLDPAWKSISPTSAFKWGVRAIFAALFLGGIFIQSSAIFDEQAQAEKEKGHFEHALRKEEWALRLFPYDASYDEHKAQLDFALYRKTGEKTHLDTMKHDFEKALALDSIKPLYLFEFGEAIIQTGGDIRDAEGLIERAILLDPMNYPMHQTRLGDILLEEGRTKEAEDTYGKVIALYPENQLFSLQFFRMPDYQNALALAHLGLAKVALKKDNTKKAEGEIEIASRLAPDQPEVNYIAGLLSLNRRDLKEAKKNFQKAKVDERLAGESWKWLAYVELNLKHNKAALEAIQKAMALGNRGAASFVIAGDIYQIEGEREEAARMWQKASELDPKNQLIRQRINGSFREKDVQ